jgi:hypothetical protein
VKGTRHGRGGEFFVVDSTTLRRWRLQGQGLVRSRGLEVRSRGRPLTRNMQDRIRIFWIPVQYLDGFSGWQNQ